MTELWTLAQAAAPTDVMSSLVGGTVGTTAVLGFLVRYLLKRLEKRDEVMEKLIAASTAATNAQTAQMALNTASLDRSTVAFQVFTRQAGHTVSGNGGSTNPG